MRLHDTYILSPTRFPARLKPMVEKVPSWWFWAQDKVVRSQLSYEDAERLKGSFMKHKALTAFKDEGILEAINYVP